MRLPFLRTRKLRMRRLLLEPGDVLVVTLDKRPTAAQAEAVIDHISEVVPGHLVLVMPPGVEFSAISPSQAREMKAVAS